MPRAKKLKLDWEYCECGCHCHEVQIGGMSFQLFNDLKGNFSLGVNQQWYCSTAIGFSSFEEADEYAYWQVRKHLGTSAAQIGMHLAKGVKKG